MDSVGARLQLLKPREQVIALARIAQDRGSGGRFTFSELESLFADIGLPGPGDLRRTTNRLANDGMLVKSGDEYRLSPLGRKSATELADDMDVAVLFAEGGTGIPTLGATGHPVVPPSLAPPDLIGPLHKFFKTFPFETNVFGMTRFPDDDEDKEPDPVAPTLQAARAVCEKHGLRFHLASDRQIVDDLWPNVAAHIWACKYAVAFFEDRRGRGINYNLSIEVGSTIVLGRRVAILKDESIERLPTDLTGRIYKSVDLDEPATVRSALETWIKDDLAL